MNEGYVSVIGSLNYDIIIKQTRLPLAGETFTADHVVHEGGGKGSNQAVQCAKLGLNTYMFGKVGEDSFGDQLIKKLIDYGVNTKYVERSNRDTGLGVVHVLEDGTVYATIAEGANGEITIPFVEKHSEIIFNSKIIILQMEIPIETIEMVIEKAKQQNICVILNAAPAKEINHAILKKVDYLVINETEASFYAKKEINNLESAKSYSHLLSEIAKVVIITLGSAGSLLCNKAKSIYIPAVKAKEVIETTGAGDSYIGAFCYFKYLGKSDEEACNFAAKAAAVTVTKIGAQASMPYIAEV